MGLNQTSSERQRMNVLERENRQRHRANEPLRMASAYLAYE